MDIGDTVRMDIGDTVCMGIGDTVCMDIGVTSYIKRIFHMIHRSLWQRSIRTNLTEA